MDKYLRDMINKDEYGYDKQYKYAKLSFIGNLIVVILLAIHCLAECSGCH